MSTELQLWSALFVKPISDSVSLSVYNTEKQLRLLYCLLSDNIVKQICDVILFFFRELIRHGYVCVYIWEYTYMYTYAK
jgi:hypothetical protein